MVQGEIRFNFIKSHIPILTMYRNPNRDYDDSDRSGDTGGPGEDVAQESSSVCSFAASLQPFCSSCCKVKERKQMVILLNIAHFMEIFTL